MGDDPDVLIRWIYSPQAGTLVVMVPMGPERWGPDSEEWVIHVNYPVDDPRAQSDEQVEADVRKALGLPDVLMDIHKITRWSVDAVLASSFQVGRVFLVGDAAHRHPPTGGLGLTSAMHDVQNLCWKLAAVLDGHASPELLETYEQERSPVDARNCQRSLENAVNHFQTVAALGVSPEHSCEENWANLSGMWSGRPEDAEHRSRILRMMRMQSMEFNELNVEFGFTYESAWCPTEPGAATGGRRPGVRALDATGLALPARMDRRRGRRRRAIKDLVAPGRFCRSPARTARRGATRRAGSPPTPACRSTRCGSVTWTATSSTRACTWVAARVRAGGRHPGAAGPVRRWRRMGASAAPAEDLERARHGARAAAPHSHDRRRVTPRLRRRARRLRAGRSGRLPHC